MNNSQRTKAFLEKSTDFAMDNLDAVAIVISVLAPDENGDLTNQVLFASHNDLCDKHKVEFSQGIKENIIDSLDSLKEDLLSKKDLSDCGQHEEEEPKLPYPTKSKALKEAYLETHDLDIWKEMPESIWKIIDEAKGEKQVKMLAMTLAVGMQIQK